MKRRVEDRNMGNAWQNAPRLHNPLDRGGVVQRRQLDEGLESGLQRIVDERWLAKLPSVHDTMGDRFHIARCVKGFDRAALVAVDDVELQARRAGVDYEDGQPGQVQSRISGGSSPCTRP
jgi:hypothetical protein